MSENAPAIKALVMSTVAFTVCFACWVLNAVLVTFFVEQILDVAETQGEPDIKPDRADLSHHQWLRLKVTDGKPNGDVTMPYADAGDRGNECLFRRKGREPPCGARRIAALSADQAPTAIIGCPHMTAPSILMLTCLMWPCATHSSFQSDGSLCRPSTFVGDANFRKSSDSGRRQSARSATKPAAAMVNATTMRHQPVVIQ
jgi:hypothetical protein